LEIVGTSAEVLGLVKLEEFILRPLDSSMPSSGGFFTPSPSRDSDVLSCRKDV
jgi:hypothetical protein